LPSPSNWLITRCTMLHFLVQLTIKKSSLLRLFHLPLLGNHKVTVLSRVAS
jgi:hypothetical protein